MGSYSQDVDMPLKICSIEECVSLDCSNQINHCEPEVEFPSSPRTELMDIEDFPCRSPCQFNAIEIPVIDIDMDALKKNVMDANLEDGSVLKELLTPENACIPMELPGTTKYYQKLRTEHVV